jgi:hypothetical protein
MRNFYYFTRRPGTVAIFNDCRSRRRSAAAMPGMSDIEFTLRTARTMRKVNPITAINLIVRVGDERSTRDRVRGSSGLSRQ